MARKKKATSESDQAQAVLEPITPIQQRFIEALLTGKNITEAALVSGVSRRAACYWLDNEKHPVRREYDKQRVAMRDEFQRRIATIHNLAFNALEDLLAPSTPPFIRVQALGMVYKPHLQPHADIVWPGAPAEIVRHEIEQLIDPLSPGRRNGIYLYDDRGRERLPEDY